MIFFDGCNERVGFNVGIFVVVGAVDGCGDGFVDGLTFGKAVIDGNDDGERVSVVGRSLGAPDGIFDGCLVGGGEGKKVGSSDGFPLGDSDGFKDG